MRTLNRRDFTHSIKDTLNLVAQTGEPVEIPTPGGGPSVVLVRGGEPGDRYSTLVAAGIVQPATSKTNWDAILEAPKPELDVPFDEFVDELKGDW